MTAFRPDPLWPPRPILVLGEAEWEWVDLAELPSEELWHWRDACEAAARHGADLSETAEWIDKALADRGETTRPEPVPFGDRRTNPYPTT